MNFDDFKALPPDKQQEAARKALEMLPKMAGVLRLLRPILASAAKDDVKARGLSLQADHYLEIMTMLEAEGWICATCHGGGYHPPTSGMTCTACNGQGWGPKYVDPTKAPNNPRCDSTAPRGGPGPQ